MIDWLSSMQQTFEYYVVDPATWKDLRPLDTVISSSIDRDNSEETLGHASISTTEDLGECYIRIYLTAIQNGVKERFALGTYLVQTQPTSFDGKVQNISMDAYSPLIELKEKNPPIGYSLLKNTSIMSTAAAVCAENLRAPVIAAVDDTTLNGDFVSAPSDTWLTFLADFIKNAKYSFELDEMGRVLFAPTQRFEAMRPVWTYDDDNSSILYPEVSVDRDLYGIPNVVEVVYSTGPEALYSRVVNDDPNSPISTVSRGREIVNRITDPDISGYPTQAQIDEYAREALRSQSTLEYTISYKHGYCPVRVGDCIMLNYSRANLANTKARVTSQHISCESGCPVEETAVFTRNLWG